MLVVVIVRWRVGSPHAEVWPRPSAPTSIVVVAPAVVASVIGFCGLCPGFWRRRAVSNGVPGGLFPRFCDPKAFHRSAGVSNRAHLHRSGGSNLMRFVGGSCIGASAYGFLLRLRILWYVGSWSGPRSRGGGRFGAGFGALSGRPWSEVVRAEDFCSLPGRCESEFGDPRCMARWSLWLFGVRARI